jgi:hypothetical protein
MFQRSRVSLCSYMFHGQTPEKIKARWTAKEQGLFLLAEAMRVRGTLCAAGSKRGGYRPCFGPNRLDISVLYMRASPVLAL